MLQLLWPGEDDQGRLRRRGPWPGPIPYEEGDQYYRGRSSDRERLLPLARSRRLLLVTGHSGIGKTSLLRAAVVTKLRVERAQTVRVEHKSETIVPAVLVVRDWLGKGRKSPRHYDDIMKDAIASAIGELPSLVRDNYPGAEHVATREMLGIDHRAMSDKGLRTNGPAYDYVIRLARKVGSLLLCIDQFEEVLLGEDWQRDGMLNTVADLVTQQDANVRLLLSFRQEFDYLFRRLDDRIGNLKTSTIFLEPIPQSRLEDALVESAKLGGVDLDNDALQELFGWLTAYREKSGSSRGVDLLRLQALLRELYELALEESDSRANRRGARKHKRASDPSIVIGVGTLKRFLSQERERTGNEMLRGEDVVETALRLFIDRRVLPLPRVQSGSDVHSTTISANTGLPRHGELSDTDEKRMLDRLQERRVAARTAEYFSSLGLKVQQYGAHLIASAMREEWEALGASAESIEKYLDAVGLEEALTALSGLGLTDDRIDPDDPVLSGRARRESTRLEALARLLGISLSSLDRLDKGNVLRPKVGRKGVLYELVHDGFGPALYEWSEDMRSDPLYALGGMTAQRGAAFRWKCLGGAVERVCWRGGIVEPATGCETVLFDDVEWLDCDLRGTFFDRCHFRGGSFQNGHLDGVIFRDCVFSPSSPSTKFVFEGVSANGLTFLNCSLNNVDFTRCRLEKMLWETTHASKSFAVADVSLSQCQGNWGICQWTVRAAGLDCRSSLKLDRCHFQLCDLNGLSHPGIEVTSCLFDLCLMNPTLDKIVKKAGGLGRSPTPQLSLPEAKRRK